jgi:hypothetical protein
MEQECNAARHKSPDHVLPLALTACIIPASTHVHSQPILSLAIIHVAVAPPAASRTAYSVPGCNVPRLLGFIVSAQAAGQSSSLMLEVHTVSLLCRCMTEVMSYLCTYEMAAVQLWFDTGIA